MLRVVYFILIVVSVLSCASKKYRSTKKNSLHILVDNNQNTRHIFRVYEDREHEVVWSTTTNFSNPKISKHKSEVTPYSRVEIATGTKNRPTSLWALKGTSTNPCRVLRGRADKSVTCDIDLIQKSGKIVSFSNVASLRDFHSGGGRAVQSTILTIVDNNEFWYQAVNLNTGLPTTPLLPEIVFQSNQPRIILPDGNVWPLQPNGERVSGSPTIAAYKAAGSGYIVAHRMIDDSILYGLANYKGEEVIGAEYKSVERYTANNDGWFLGQRFDNIWEIRTLLPAAKGLMGRGKLKKQAIKEAYAQKVVNEKLAEARKGKYKQDLIELNARAGKWLAEARAKEAAEAQAQQARYRSQMSSWCGGVGSKMNSTSLSNLVGAIRTCSKYSSKAYIDKMKSTLKRRKIEEQQRPVQVYRGYTFKSSSPRNRSNSFDSRAWKNKMDRGNRRFRQTMDYINGSSAYNPNKSYRSNR